MLLVMSTQGMFQPNDGPGPAGHLWEVTWTFLSPFLPNLKEELFPPVPEEYLKRGSVEVTGEAAVPAEPAPEVQSTEPEAAATAVPAEESSAPVEQEVLMVQEPVETAAEGAVQAEDKAETASA